MRRACRNTTTGTPQPQPRPTLRRQCRDFCQIEWELHRMESKLDKKKKKKNALRRIVVLYSANSERGCMKPTRSTSTGSPGTTYCLQHSL